jgi:CheY-like chemotaxis protein
MGGDIWVTSEDGVGSCFGFTLQLGIAPDGMPDSTPDLSQVGPIMVVSEDLATRNVLARQLGRIGAEVIACASGAAALETARPDCALIIADHQMAELDGLALADQLQGNGVQTPILLLSTAPGDADKHPLRDRVQGVLQFPPPRRDLIDQIKELTGVEDANQPAEDRKLRILAAEDNKTNQLVFSKMIKNLNVDLKFAGNGQEAVTFYQDFQPDIVFMDISMPIMDGKEATAAIRKLENVSGQKTPIVALTAHAMEGDGASILAAGLDHYLTKPLRKPEIIARIEEAHGAGMQPLLPDQVDG